MRFVCLAAALAPLLLTLSAGSAAATPGMGEAVYGTEFEEGVTTLESRYVRLNGGPADAEWVWRGEAEHAFSDRFTGSLIANASRAPGDTRFDAVGIEGVYRVATLPGGVGFAVYGEYDKGLNGAGDAVEAKLLFEKKHGSFDGRLNLIAGRDFEPGERTQYGYAASVDWRVAEDWRAGVQAFGGLGDPHGFGGRREHYVGPFARAEFDEGPVKGLGVEAAYLFAAGEARQDANGQFRLLVEWEHRF